MTFTPPFNPPDAPCKGATALFFQDQRGDSTNTERAKAVCQTCPHIAPCLDYAITNEEQFGVWGGMSLRQRRKYADTRRITRQRVAAPIRHGWNTSYERCRLQPGGACRPCKDAYNDYRRNNRPSRATGDAA